MFIVLFDENSVPAGISLTPRLYPKDLISGSSARFWKHTFFKAEVRLRRNAASLCCVDRIVYAAYSSIMDYFLNLFTPETWKAFQENGSNVSGFRYRQRRMAREEVQTGDIFLCYLVRLSRWCGALRIVSEAYKDDEPIFETPDPFVIRFKVEPIILLEPMRAIPIFEDEVWENLSETRGIEKGASG